MCHKPRNVSSLQMQQAANKGKTMQLHCGPKMLYFPYVRNERQISQERPYDLLSKKYVILLSFVAVVETETIFHSGGQGFLVSGRANLYIFIKMSEMNLISFVVVRNVYFYFLSLLAFA